MEHRSRILVTGANGFTGRHLIQILKRSGHEVLSLKSNLLDSTNLQKELISAKPQYLVHLAGLSFSEHENIEELYRVNTVGTMNLLDSCLKYGQFSRVLIASSAAVYGDQVNPILDETLCPSPVSHYGCSKLSMEHLSDYYRKYFRVTVVRPFNYTGPGHHEKFIIPKIVKACKEKASKISVGNVEVYREFNDVRDVCSAYEALLLGDYQEKIVNICSGNAISLADVLKIMGAKFGYYPVVDIEKKFIRRNEIHYLSGNPERLIKLTGHKFKYSIEDTLNWMLS